MGLGRTCEGIRARASVVLTPASTPLVIATAAATVALGALLGHQLVELAVLEHLAEGPHRKAQDRHGGAQIEGLLQRANGAHFVVAQPDSETTAFAVSLAPPSAAATTAFAAAITLSALLAGIAVGISHGLRPGVRRKCDASPHGFRGLLIRFPLWMSFQAVRREIVLFSGAQR